MKKIVIVGGGMAGLIAANILPRAGVECVLIEKKAYPFHRVCGEYISNETAPFLKSLDLFPTELGPTQIRRFQLTSVNGKSAELPLRPGGFGVSRFAFDAFLFQRAQSAGAVFRLNTEVEDIQFGDNQFEVRVRDGVLSADVVIGAFGKRSKLDVAMDRAFYRRRSPYLAVKHHVKTRHPDDLIALHNFRGGYCGISNVEGDKSCLCYLTHRHNLKEFGTLPVMEENVLFRNPFLKTIFRESDFLFEKPEVINEINFETKGPVAQHILMAGDAAGMITPLCGNGMAIAIHASKILCEQVIDFCKEKQSRAQLESRYRAEWRRHFATRLWAGRQIQRLFGGVTPSNLAVAMARNAKPLANFLISQTHGDPF